jgi:hypothetical protein
MVSVEPQTPTSSEGSEARRGAEARRPEQKEKEGCAVCAHLRQWLRWAAFCEGWSWDWRRRAFLAPLHLHAAKEVEEEMK